MRYGVTLFVQNQRPRAGLAGVPQSFGRQDKRILFTVDMASRSGNTLARLVTQDPSFAVCAVGGNSDKEDATLHRGSVTVVGRSLQLVHENGSRGTCTFRGTNDSLKWAFLLDDVPYVVEGQSYGVSVLESVS